ncbi:hypothetical protein IKF04_00200 [Candidatus Saccharibacteria bacterium]|nr:hypothetical protein [Candidatus Saccharibacteria bacterium]
MFFDDVSEIPVIAKNVDTSVFVVPNDAKVEIPQALVLQPENKTTITIEQVRDIVQFTQKKQLSDFFVIVRPADTLNLEASNALLKMLEEPQDKIHFVLVTEFPSQLLATILSRSAVYFLRKDAEAIRKINADDELLALAKKLVIAKPPELVALAEEITRKKDNVRQRTLTVLGVAIEILYKAYLINRKEVFLSKIPKFLAAYDAICSNGHIKLHLVADLL